MAVPFGVKFDNFAQATSGLVAYGAGPAVQVNGVALVTGFLFAEIWNRCFDPVATTWTACAAMPATAWTDNNPSNPTTWTVMG